MEHSPGHYGMVQIGEGGVMDMMFLLSSWAPTMARIRPCFAPLADRTALVDGSTWPDSRHTNTSV